MSADSSELTFVRCPSCRSLVPAVSTRCRMCGAALDATAKESDESGGDAAKSKRVRQRTMSQPQNELTSAATTMRSEAPPVVPQEPPFQAAPVSNEEAEETEIDPLHDYLADDLGDEPAVVSAKATAAPSKPVAASAPSGSPNAKPASKPGVADEGPVFGDDDGDDDDDFDDEDLSWILKAVTGTPEKSGAKTGEETKAPPSAKINTEPPRPAAPPQRPPPLEAKPATPPHSAPRSGGNEGRDSKPNVIVESGQRGQGKPSNLSFGRGKEEPKAPVREAEKPRVEAAQPVEPPKREQPQQRKEEVRKEEAREERREDRQAFRPQEPAQSPQQQRPSQPVAPQKAPVQREIPGQQGRLFGWFVSYADPNGNAIELREGKFFISGRSLKGNDLVIDAESVSTPHAMVNVDASDGLQVQDLMSERGVFLRRKGRDTYERKGETFKVENGDWVRFGDVEYLVSLIAHVGVK